MRVAGIGRARAAWRVETPCDPAPHVAAGFDALAIPAASSCGTGSVRRAERGDIEASIARAPANAEKRIKQRSDRRALSPGQQAQTEMAAVSEGQRAFNRIPKLDVEQGAGGVRLCFPAT